MISEVRGRLRGVDGETNQAMIDPGIGLVLGVLLTARGSMVMAGRVGSEVRLRTYCFLESSNQGATFTPRLAGFVSRHEAGMFELLTSVKGIGARKALRMMALPSPTIASAIAAGDIKTLQALPEIGKRTAEGIVLTLQDRVGKLPAEARSDVQPDPIPGISPAHEPMDRAARTNAQTPPDAASAAEAGDVRGEGIGADPGAVPGSVPGAVPGADWAVEALDLDAGSGQGSSFDRVMQEAVETLVQLGEPRLEAIELLREAARRLQGRRPVGPEGSDGATNAGRVPDSPLGNSPDLGDSGDSAITSSRLVAVAYQIRNL